MKPDSIYDAQALFETHGVFVSRLARALVADEHTAEDLAHETWAAVLRRPPVGVGDVRAWLSTILRRRVASYRRRLRRGGQVELAEVEVALAAAREADEFLQTEEVLHRAVRALREPYRTTIFLRYHGGLTPRVIAERTGVPVKTVKTRLCRGLAQLRVAMDGDVGGAANAGADGGKDWRLALMPIVSLRAAGSKGLPAGAVVSQWNVSLSLFAGMKKFLALAVLLLVSVVWFTRLSGPPDQGATPSVPGREEVSLAELDEQALAPPLAEPVAREELDASAPEPSPAELVATDRGVIAVEVKDGAGAPIVGRTVVLEAWPWASAAEPPVVRRTDSAGQATFSRLPAARFVVSDGQGDSEEDIELAVGETKTLVWTPEDEVLVRGLVMDASGAPVPDALIWSSTDQDSLSGLYPAHRADKGGRFELRCSAKALIQATSAGLFPSRLRPVRSAPEVDPGVREVTFYLVAPGGALTGRVVDVLGRPIPGATVAVRPAAWPNGLTGPMGTVGNDPRPTPAVSDHEGRYETPSGFPSGDHFVIVRAKGFAAAVSVVPFGEGSVDHEFVLHRGVEVSGTVLGPDGSPAPKAHVWIADQGSEWRAYGSGDRPLVECDSQGRYTLRRVAPGRVALRARAGWADPLARAELAVEVMETSIEGLLVPLDPGRTILGRTVDGDGIPVAGVVVTARSEPAQSSDVRSRSDGSFEITALPEPGGEIDEWELIARVWTGTSTEVIGRLTEVVPGGEPMDIVVERIEPASGAIVGRVESLVGRIPGDVEARMTTAGGSGGSPLAFDPKTGAFHKGPLLPGTYRIELLRAGVPVTVKSGLVVAPGETIDAGVIRLEDG